MNRKQIKDQIKNAYWMEPSDREYQFLKKYEMRSMQMWDVLWVELRYMGLHGLVCAALIITLLALMVVTLPQDSAGSAMSFLPLGVLCPLVSTGRSNLYGMSELEEASRFSLRFIKMIRLFILGIISVLIVLTGTIISGLADGGLPDITVCLHSLVQISMPVLFTICGCMHITRKWHGNVFGCFAMTMVSCMVPFAGSIIGWQLSFAVLMAGAIVLMLLCVGESYLYVKESEDLLWNFC